MEGEKAPISLCECDEQAGRSGDHAYYLVGAGREDRADKDAYGYEIKSCS